MTVADDGLFDGLNVTIDDEAIKGVTITNWASLAAGSTDADKSYSVVIELPENSGNEYQGKSCSIKFAVEAVQGNAYTEDRTVYNVTPATAQKCFDGEMGSLDNAVIYLGKGVYDGLEFGRATKYAGTSYYIGGFDQPVMTYQEFIDELAQPGWHGQSYYDRAISNLTIIGQEGAVVKNLSAASGHIYGVTGAPAHDYVLDRETESTNNSYYL